MITVGPFACGQYHWVARVVGPSTDRDEFGDQMIKIQYFSADGGKNGEFGVVSRRLLRKRRYATPDFPFKVDDVVEWLHSSNSVWLRATIQDIGHRRNSPLISLHIVPENGVDGGGAVVDAIRNVQRQELSIVFSSGALTPVRPPHRGILTLAAQNTMDLCPIR